MATNHNNLVSEYHLVPLLCLNMGSLGLSRTTAYFLKKTHPEAFWLDQIDWKVMGILTSQYASYRRPSEESRAKWILLWKKLIRKFCAKYDVPLRQLTFFHSIEYGRSNNCHFNFLIGKDRLEHISDSDFISHLKDNLADNRVGRVWIQTYRPELNGCDYINKVEYVDFHRQIVRDPKSFFSPKLKKRIMKIAN